ncbi:uncharacterized protein [Patagioenas fasciata]|uniref:uncharacterized protein n=1 Tax=Patagioenas fasciata TaxID=372321 RepID=UPI003A9985FE
MDRGPSGVGAPPAPGREVSPGRGAPAAPNLWAGSGVRRRAGWVPGSPLRAAVCSRHQPPPADAAPALRLPGSVRRERGKTNPRCPLAPLPPPAPTRRGRPPPAAGPAGAGLPLPLRLGRAPPSDGVGGRNINSSSCFLTPAVSLPENTFGYVGKVTGLPTAWLGQGGLAESRGGVHVEAAAPTASVPQTKRRAKNAHPRLSKPSRPEECRVHEHTCADEQLVLLCWQGGVVVPIVTYPAYASASCGTQVKHKQQDEFPKTQTSLNYRVKDANSDGTILYPGVCKKTGDKYWNYEDAAAVKTDDSTRRAFPGFRHLCWSLHAFVGYRNIYQKAMRRYSVIQRDWE